jgi:catechol 2,3-dioxygenase-like lactoylglutathione lyase family enzyme
MGLSDSRVLPVIAVSDIGKAKEFYEGVMGLSGGVERPDGGIRYPCGKGSELHVYPSPDNAGKSTATLAGFEVSDVEATIDELTSRGATFEQYDADPIRTDAKGIARIGDTYSAWLKDPDGNIISINQEQRP